jgi:hypothetical protein
LGVPQGDEITHKLAMLIEGECEGLGPIQAAKKFGFSKQRYFQLRAAFLEQGALALLSQKRGPKTQARRTVVAIMDGETKLRELQDLKIRRAVGVLDIWHVTGA